MDRRRCSEQNRMNWGSASESAAAGGGQQYGHVRAQSQQAASGPAGKNTLFLDVTGDAARWKAGGGGVGRPLGSPPQSSASGLPHSLSKSYSSHEDTAQHRTRLSQLLATILHSRHNEALLLQGTPGRRNGTIDKHGRCTIMKILSWHIATSQSFKSDYFCCCV